MGRRELGAAYSILHRSGAKDVEFSGSSDDDLRGFPQVAPPACFPFNVGILYLLLRERGALTH